MCVERVLASILLLLSFAVPVSVHNVSSEPAMILFFFNTPAFEQCLRAMSSRPGGKFVMPPSDKMRAVRAECHEVMQQ